MAAPGERKEYKPLDLKKFEIFVREYYLKEAFEVAAKYDRRP